MDKKGTQRKHVKINDYQIIIDRRLLEFVYIQALFNHAK